MFSMDRDLLALEPNLFREVAWHAQVLATGTASLAAGVLTFTQPVLAGTGVAAGHVVLVGLTPMEVLEVSSDDTLVVSLVRSDLGAAQSVPMDRADVSVVLATFMPQRALTHRQLLAMLGIRAGPAIRPDDVLESQILNPRELAHVECLGALHLIYAAASAALPDESAQSRRALMYQQRFARERWRARAEIDLNGDGMADAQRTLNISHLLRA